VGVDPVSKFSGGVVDPPVQPLALGYIREDRWMSEEELARATCVLAEFADREGYALGTVYIERVERTPAAFESLIATAIRDEAVAIVVPGFEHLQLIGSAPELAAHMAKTTGARVLNADTASHDAPHGTVPDAPAAVPKAGPISGCEW
jgi:hypothetical protein